MTERGQLPKLIDCGAYVYVLDCDHGVKVGITIQSVEERVDDLARGSGLTGIRVVRSWPFAKRADARSIELGAHWILRETRTVGEWFHCHPLEACDAVDRCMRHGLPLEAFAGSAAPSVRAWLARQKDAA